MGIAAFVRSLFVDPRAEIERQMAEVMFRNARNTRLFAELKAEHKNTGSIEKTCALVAELDNVSETIHDLCARHGKAGT